MSKVSRSFFVLFCGFLQNYGDCKWNAHTFSELDEYDHYDGLFNPDAAELLEPDRVRLNLVPATLKPVNPTLPPLLPLTTRIPVLTLRPLVPQPLYNFNSVPQQKIFATAAPNAPLNEFGQSFNGVDNELGTNPGPAYPNSYPNLYGPNSYSAAYGPGLNSNPGVDGSNWRPATYGPNLNPGVGQSSNQVRSQALLAPPRAVPGPIPPECKENYSGSTANLQRLYSKLLYDHLYVTEMNRKIEAVVWGGYKYEKNTAKLAMSDQEGCPCLKKLYRLKNSAVANLFVRDHFYTINKDREMLTALEIGYKTDGPLGLEATGIHRNDSYEGFCVENKGECGATVPIYQLFFKERPDHYLTSRPEDRDDAIAKGYEDNGIECWAWPPDDEEHCC